MIMRHWRVGSLSMGLVLVASGILMLTSLIVKVNVLDIIMTFWPVILICLGIEILLHLFVKKGGDTDGKLRYDALSILFIGFLLVISTGFYAATYYAGLYESREDMHAAFGIMNESAFLEDSATLTGTKKLTVFNDFNSLTALPASDGKLKVEYSISVGTYDKVYAETMLGGAVKLEPGERAYLRSDTTRFHNDRKVGWPTIDCVIYLPPEATLDLSQFWGSLEFDNEIENQIIRQ